jgi:hypothetical protein
MILPPPLPESRKRLYSHDILLIFLRTKIQKGFSDDVTPRRREMKKLMTMLMMLVSGWSYGASTVLSGPIIYESGLAYDKVVEVDLDKQGIDYLSYTVTFGSTTFGTKTFQNGRASTSTITVADNAVTALVASVSTNSVTVVSTNGLTGAVLTMKTHALREGIHWQAVGTTTGTAINLMTAINQYVNGVVASTSSGSSVIRATSTATGVVTNSYAAVSSTPAALSVGKAFFFGGQDHAVLTVNGTALTQGTEWSRGATAGATATSIYGAINTAFPGVIVSSAVGATGVVYSTSVAVGVATKYAVTSSTIALTATNFTGGVDSDYTIGSSVIGVAGHGYTTALPVLYTGTPAIGGLTTGTTYFVIPVSADSLAFASSKANAILGTAIPATSSTTQTTADTYTITPSTTIGNTSFYWQVSNDGTNWVTLTTPPTVTFTSFVNPSTSTVTDLGLVNYRKMRVNVTAPTTGGVLLQIFGHGKSLK